MIFLGLLNVIQPAEWAIFQLIPDYRELFYISVSSKMVVALEEQILALNLPREQTKRDSFRGYD